MKFATSHNASPPPYLASTRGRRPKCSEAPSRVWSEGRHNERERELSWLTNSTAHNRLNTPARAAVTPALAPDRALRVPARRSAFWSWRPQVLPAQEGLQVLHREDRCYLLPRRSLAAGFCGRARQDRSAPSDRRVRTSSAPPQPGDQAVAQHCAAGFCFALLTFRRI